MFFSEVQFILLFMCHLKPFPWTILASLMYGQIMHFLHDFMPFNFRFWWVSNFGGNLALLRKSLKFFCLLNATKGGSGNTVARCSSCPVMDRQCFLCISGRSGNLGSKVTANAGLLVCFVVTTFFRAWVLGMALALLIEASMRLGLYFLATKNSFNS